MIGPWEPPRSTGEPRIAEITPMQRNVFESLCEGKSNAQIGVDWGISLDTTKSHVRDLLKATGARDRLHLVSMAYRRELVVEVVRNRGWAQRDQPATLGDVGTYAPAS